MAIVGFFEVWDGRDHVANDQRERNYTRTFKCVVNTATTDPAEIRLYPGCPRVWSIYASANGLVDSGSWCREVHVRQDATDPYLFIVTCTYSNRIERQDLNIIENPLLRPAEIEWDTEPRARVAWTDREGDAVRNSAGERFDPPLEREENISVLTITKNQLLYDQFGYVGYRNSVNSKAWFNQLPGAVKCAHIKGSRQFENGIYFWRATFTFHMRENLDSDPTLPAPQRAAETWAYRVLDQGYFEIVGGNRRPIILPGGAYPTSPVLLDGGGGQLPVGDPPEFLLFQLLPERDFNALNLV